VRAQFIVTVESVAHDRAATLLIPPMEIAEFTRMRVWKGMREVHRRVRYLWLVFEAWREVRRMRANEHNRHMRLICAKAKTSCLVRLEELN
jgi:hypothetical protein